MKNLSHNIRQCRIRNKTNEKFCTNLQKYQQNQFVFGKIFVYQNDFKIL